MRAPLLPEGPPRNPRTDGTGLRRATAASHGRRVLGDTTAARRGGAGARRGGSPRVCQSRVEAAAGRAGHHPPAPPCCRRRPVPAASRGRQGPAALAGARPAPGAAAAAPGGTRGRLQASAPAGGRLPSSVLPLQKRACRSKTTPARSRRGSGGEGPHGAAGAQARAARPSSAARGRRGPAGADRGRRGTPAPSCRQQPSGERRAPRCLRAGAGAVPSLRPRPGTRHGRETAQRSAKAAAPSPGLLRCGQPVQQTWLIPVTHRWLPRGGCF